MDPSADSPSPAPPPRGWTDRFLDGVEWLGNKLPDPVMLFLGALILTWAASALLAHVEFTEIDPRTLGPDRKPAAVQIKSQLEGQTLVTFLARMVRTFVEFPPLGLVLVVLLGVGVAEHTGFIHASLKALLSITPHRLLTPMVMLVAILSHAAGDSGYVVVIPLGGVIFAAAGRHPLAGIALAFAGVSGGLSANFIPIMLDPLLQGFTQHAAQIMDRTYSVNPLCNYGFTAASSFLLILLAWFLNDRLVEPRLRGVPLDEPPPTPTQTGEANQTPPPSQNAPTLERLDPREWYALGAAFLAVGVMLLVVVVTAQPPTSPWRSPQGELLTAAAPLVQSLVPLMFLLFLVPGIIYGYLAGTVRSHRDIIQGMSKAMAAMSYYLVLAFVAAQFIYAFTQSNVGILIALKGGDLLQRLEVSPQVTIVGIILISALFNLLIGSASAKWGLLSPIFVPMLMQLGLSPELTQAAYRIGDSSTNIITPLMPYFPLVVVYCQRYVKSTGIGTLMALMLPYALSFLVFWTLLLLGYWALGLPLGLDAPYTYPP